MRFAWRIAVRYLLSKKQHNAVNIISWISVAGVAVATMAIVVVLSVFNGFNRLALQQLSRMDAPYAVSMRQGKSISSADSVAEVIRRVDGVTAVVPVIRELALATAPDRQMPIQIMGVPEEFVRASGIDSIIIDGTANLRSEDPLTAISSVGVALGLNVRPGSYDVVEVYVPRRVGRINATNPMTAFRSEKFYMTGVYQVEQETYDADMLIIPIESARMLLCYDDDASQLLVYADDISGGMQQTISETLGSDYVVKNRMQQQEQSFKMIQVEKWVTFLMLTFILIIASFNIISTLSMLIIEKEGNRLIFRAMGADNRKINLIYVLQGWLISVAGGVAGIIIGVALSLTQEWFGVIKLNSSNPGGLLIESYPVEVHGSDILIVAAIILVMGMINGSVAIKQK